MPPRSWLFHLCNFSSGGSTFYSLLWPGTADVPIWVKMNHYSAPARLRPNTMAEIR